MESQNVCGSGGNLYLTMVELSLAQLNQDGIDFGHADDHIAGASGCRDRNHDVSGTCYLEHESTVTQPVPYVTNPQTAYDTDLDQYRQQTTSLLDFNLDCLSPVEPHETLSESSDSKDPITTISTSTFGDYLSFDRAGKMPCSEVETDACDKMEVGRRKKAVPRRRKQTAANKPEAVTRVPSSDRSLVKQVDDYTRLVEYVPVCLEKFGFCVVDRFARKSLALSVRNEVLELYKKGSFEDGLLTSEAFAFTEVRGDRVFWLESEDDEQCAGICKLIRRLDDLFLRLRGCLGSCNISSRSKAMLACYPGQGRCYRRHVDNPNQDGRAITAIFYINKSWNAQRDGGVLRMYPSQLPDKSVDVEPIFDRIIFFWSDSRTPHEVQPAYRDRYAITVWYFNDVERQQARQRFALQGSHVDNPRLASVALSTTS